MVGVRDWLSRIVSKEGTVSPPPHLSPPPAPTRGPVRISGIMSGTSADGVDVAVCLLEHSAADHWGKLEAFTSVPYSPELRGHIHELRRLGACTLDELTGLTRRITLEHASAIDQALAEARFAPTDVALLADHGQTLFHAPPLTLQLLDPALLAVTTGIPVLSDFRRADCALGGQGAPLVPYADRRLFQHPSKTRALLNLGGIANLTLVAPPGSSRPLTAFDVGPANCISDHLCRRHDPNGPGFDRGGHMAVKGRPNESVIAAFLSQPYFRAPTPKSTDGPAMIAAFEHAGGMRLSLHEALATAAECTARAITDAVQLLHPTPDELILSGGGAHNLAVTQALTRLLPEVHLMTTDQLGIPGSAKEAIAFALLGAAWLDGAAGNVPSCTGASRPALLGSLTLPG